MKRRINLIILLVAITLSGTAQTIGDAFYIYRNDGQFNAFFRDEIQNIEYSYEDVDGNHYDEIVTQVINTNDSIYKIPLAAIDSVVFVQPKTIYKEDVIRLDDDLYNYVIDVDGMELTLSSQTPASIIPTIGDKVAAVELTEKFPYGFLGRVTSVNISSNGINIICTPIDLDEAVSSFALTIDLQTSDSEMSKLRSYRRATHEYSFDLGEHHATFDLSGVISKKDILTFSGKASVGVTIHPSVVVRTIYNVNTQMGMYVRAVITGKTSSSVKLDIAGEATKELWKKKLLSPPKDIPLPFGFTFYPELGVKAEVAGELALGMTVKADGGQNVEVVYCPLCPWLNSVTFRPEPGTSSVDWNYVAARGGAKVCAYLEFCIGYGSHKLAKVGGEFELGVKGEYESVLDLDLLRRADKETTFYENAIEQDKIDVNGYFGAYFVAALLEDADIERLKFSKGKDWEIPHTKIFQGRTFPLFEGTALQRTGTTGAMATTTIGGDCLLPQTVGFALYDSNKQRIDSYLRPQTYWNRLASDQSLEYSFTGLNEPQTYTVYPIVNWLGFDILAKPTAELKMEFPVSITEFSQIGSTYKKGGFTNNGKTYSYKYDCAVTVEMSDNKGISDWGYAYLDPDGKETLISLKEFGFSYTDNRYAYYRNEAKSTCTLYGYVKYEGADNPVYDEPHVFPLEYNNTLTCPDDNHPHWIDLGLPSGTLWRCCNEGASIPTDYGGYYEYWEISSATSRYQMQEMLDNCAFKWTTLNGTNGGLFTSNNGNAIFLPAAGYKVYSSGKIIYPGQDGSYWTSTHFMDSDTNKYRA